MKKYFIFSNIIFLLVGNVLFSSIHHLQEQHYHYDLHFEKGCQECVIVDNQNNLVITYRISPVFHSNIIFLIVTNNRPKAWYLESKFGSRAPPTSKLIFI